MTTDEVPVPPRRDFRFWPSTADTCGTATEVSIIEFKRLVRRMEGESA